MHARNLHLCARAAMVRRRGFGKQPAHIKQVPTRYGTWASKYSGSHGQGQEPSEFLPSYSTTVCVLLQYAV